MCPRIQTQTEIAPAMQTVRVEQDEDEPHGRGEREADHPQSGADLVASAAQDPFEDHQAVESHDDERNAPIWHPQRVEQAWEIASPSRVRTQAWGINEHGWQDKQKAEEQQTRCKTTLVPGIFAYHGTLQRPA